MNNLEEKLKELELKYKNWEIFLSRYRDLLSKLENKYFPEKVKEYKKWQNEFSQQCEIKLQYNIKNKIWIFWEIYKEFMETKTNPLW